jgi:DNA polymerase III subunit gamma/tau
MREIIDSVRYAPVSLRYKIYIIDEVHMLSKSAFNALLKTLEEPPPHVKFIFATTEIRKVPVTILSRCQRFDLKRLDATLLMQHYGRIAALENVTIDEESLRMIARASEGSVRDGLSLLDQAIAYGEGVVKSADVAGMMGLIDKSRIIDLFDAVMSGDTARAIHEVEAQYEGGGDPETILNDLADFVHWVTRLKVVKESALNDASRTEIEKTRGVDFATRIGMAHLSRAWQMLLKGITEVSYAAQPLLAAEMVLIRLAHAADFPQGEDLLKITKQAAPEKSAPIVMPQVSRREAPAPETVGSLAIKADVQPPQTPTETRAFSAFADVIALVVEKRDVKLKGDLERFVRPIRVRPGQVELALEQGASPGLPGELSRKLEAWTGRRWMVLVAREGGEKPLALQKKDARESAFREARDDADVQAILKRFPGATVTDVRDPETLKPMEENDEEPR